MQGPDNSLVERRPDVEPTAAHEAGEESNDDAAPDKTDDITMDPALPSEVEPQFVHQLVFVAIGVVLLSFGYVLMRLFGILPSAVIVGASFMFIAYKLFRPKKSHVRR